MSDVYINIGTEKCCLFVRLSRFLIRRLNRYPLLYFAVEEALECRKIGYSGVGIITFAQLLNLFEKQTPRSRHDIAHEILAKRHDCQALDKIIEQFKSAAAECSDQECAKQEDVDKYRRQIVTEWAEMVKRLHGI